jgi:uncharacterized protein YabE (DUF348 family)
MRREHSIEQSQPHISLRVAGLLALALTAAACGGGVKATQEVKGCADGDAAYQKAIDSTLIPPFSSRGMPLSDQDVHDVFSIIYCYELNPYTP